MPSNKLVWFAICIICILAISTSGCIGGKKTYDGKYMSFEYPEDWNISKTLDEGTSEHVILRQSNDIIGVNALKDASIEDVEANITTPNLYGPENETIGDVHCLTYYESEIDMSFYIFQKDGMTFLVTCTVGSEGIAEDIIKSLKVKK